MSKTAEAEGASLARVRAEAARLGLAIEPVRLAEGTRTAAAAAAACGCGIDQIVKSIVFREAGSDRHVLFLTAGGNRVDPAKAARLAGAPLEKADAASIRAHTGFAIGGVAPLGHLRPIDAWFDPKLLAYEVIWAAAGTPHHVFAVPPAAARRRARRHRRRLHRLTRRNPRRRRALPIRPRPRARRAMDRIFTAIAGRIAGFAGRPLAFILALACVVVWAVTGPIFGFSEVWQLVINTGTTIVTFLMVFLVQNTQNRDSAAIQAKLDELIRAVADAREQFIGIEHMTDAEIEAIRAELEAEFGDAPRRRLARSRRAPAQPALARRPIAPSTERAARSPGGSPPRPSSSIASAPAARCAAAASGSASSSSTAGAISSGVQRSNRNSGTARVPVTRLTSVAVSIRIIRRTHPDGQRVRRRRRSPSASPPPPAPG